MSRPEVTGKKIGSTDEDAYLPAKTVRARYSVSFMSIHRWLHDPELNFPKPIYIGRYRYWRLRDLVAWERGRAASREAA
jgi:predicted DNA-binding transcriptional regulator AlpA